MREYFPERPMCRRYERFLCNELIPFLMQRYRLLPERTGVAGSSMGGIVSLHLAERRRDVYTRVGALSPSVFASLWVRDHLELSPLQPDGRRIWMDMGTAEGGRDTMRGLERLRDLLQKAGWTDELVYEIIPNGRHHEHDWARCFPRVLEHLYGSRVTGDG
jgi:predicted alpha/beta superfamily hydrolase